MISSSLLNYLGKTSRTLHERTSCVTAVFPQSAKIMI